MNTIGELKKKNEVEKISDTFSKRTFLLKTDLESMYPQTLEFTLTGERMPLIDAFEPGDSLDVNFLLRGKEYITKDNKEVCINTLEVIKITKKVYEHH